jgi:hypothetical protein
LAALAGAMAAKLLEDCMKVFVKIVCENTREEAATELIKFAISPNERQSGRPFDVPAITPDTPFTFEFEGAARASECILAIHKILRAGDGL